MMATLTRDERIVLSLHGVGEIPGHVDAGERPYWCAESSFLAILDAIDPASRDAGVPVEITFDDGNASDVQLALPALVDRGLTATFFVCAGRLARPGYLDETDLVALRDAGMSIGSHGWSHADWRRIDDTTLDRELRGARERLSEVVGHDVDEVAIPFGSYDRRVVAALRQTGVRTAYTSDGGRAGTRGWLVPRETCTSTWDAVTLRSLLATRPAPRERIRRSLAKVVKRWR